MEAVLTTMVAVEAVVEAGATLADLVEVLMGAPAVVAELSAQE